MHVNNEQKLLCVSGCWNDADNKKSCKSSSCVSYRDAFFPNKQMNNSFFCCCYGNMCNNNISKEVINVYSNRSTKSPGPGKDFCVDMELSRC